MRWILIVIAALILLPLAWGLLKFALGMAASVLQIALVLAVVVFLIGLVRRLMLVR
jgi:hypothetical protein